MYCRNSFVKKHQSTSILSSSATQLPSMVSTLSYRSTGNTSSWSIQRKSVRVWKEACICSCIRDSPIMLLQNKASCEGLFLPSPYSTNTHHATFPFITASFYSVLNNKFVEVIPRRPGQILKNSLWYPRSRRPAWPLRAPRNRCRSPSPENSIASGFPSRPGRRLCIPTAQTRRALRHRGSGVKIQIFSTK